MADRFHRQYPNIDSVAFDGFEITPGSNNLISTTRALYVGGTGNVCVQMFSYEGSNTVLTFVAVPAGTILPIRVNKVFSNSTATSMVGLH